MASLSDLLRKSTIGSLYINSLPGLGYVDICSSEPNAWLGKQLCKRLKVTQEIAYELLIVWLIVPAFNWNLQLIICDHPDVAKWAKPMSPICQRGKMVGVEIQYNLESFRLQCNMSSWINFCIEKKAISSVCFSN